jgi:hypothetical protein
MLHRNGWSAVLHRDGTFEVTNPNGHTWQTKPRGPITALRQLGPQNAGAFAQHIEEIGLEAAARVGLHLARIRNRAYAAA